MADPQIPAPQGAGDPQAASFSIDRIYTKDLSLENPGSPQSFQLTEQPQVEVGMRTRGEQIAPDVYEYVLTLTVTATVAGKTLFLVEHLEIDRREMDGRKTCAHRRVGDRFAGVWKQHVRAVDRHHRLHLVRRNAADGEYPRL